MSLKVSRGGAADAERNHHCPIQGLLDFADLAQSALFVCERRHASFFTLHERMGRTVELPGVGTLHEGPFGTLISASHVVPALGGLEVDFVFEGLDGETHPEDFADAVGNFLAATDRLLTDATEYVHQYCLDMQKLWGDAAPLLDISKPSEVWKYVDLGTEVVVMRDHDAERNVFVLLECNCAWEPEHGLQLVFRNGNQISKVGPFDGHVSNESAFDDENLKGVIYRRIGS